MNKIIFILVHVIHFKYTCIGSDKIIIPNFLASPFQIYLSGGEIADMRNNIAYTDITDCLNEAIKLIKIFKEPILHWYTTINENYQSALVALNERGEII